MTSSGDASPSAPDATFSNALPISVSNGSDAGASGANPASPDSALNSSHRARLIRIARQLGSLGFSVWFCFAITLAVFPSGLILRFCLCLHCAVAVLWCIGGVCCGTQSRRKLNRQRITARASFMISSCRFPF